MVQLLPYTLSCLLLGALHLSFRAVIAGFHDHPWSSAGPLWEGIAITVLLVFAGLLIDAARLLARLWSRLAEWRRGPQTLL